MTAEKLPVLDPRRLEEIEEDLGSRAFAHAFAERFLRMLPGRIGAIASAAESGEPEAARTALLSLATSAEMVGAIQLASDTWAVEAGLRSGGCRAVPEALPRIRRDAVAAFRAIEDLLDSDPGPSPVMFKTARRTGRQV